MVRKAVQRKTSATRGRTVARKAPTKAASKSPAKRASQSPAKRKAPVRRKSPAKKATRTARASPGRVEVNKFPHSAQVKALKAGNLGAPIKRLAKTGSSVDRVGKNSEEALYAVIAEHLMKLARHMNHLEGKRATVFMEDLEGHLHMATRAGNDFELPKAPIKKLFKSMLTGKRKRVSKEAMDAIQKDLEAYVADVARRASKISEYRESKTLNPREIWIVMDW